VAFETETTTQIDGRNDLTSRKDNAFDEGRRVGNGSNVFDHFHVLDVAGAERVGRASELK